MLDRHVEPQFPGSQSTALPVVRDGGQGKERIVGTKKALRTLRRSFLLSAASLEASVRPHLWQTIIKGSVVSSCRIFDFLKRVFSDLGFEGYCEEL